MKIRKANYRKKNKNSTNIIRMTKLKLYHNTFKNKKRTSITRSFINK